MLTYRQGAGLLIVLLCVTAGLSVAQEQAPDVTAGQPWVMDCVAGVSCGQTAAARDAALLAEAIRTQYGYPESERFHVPALDVDVAAELAASIRTQYGYPGLAAPAPQAADVSAQLAASIRAQYGYPE